MHTLMKKELTFTRKKCYNIFAGWSLLGVCSSSTAAACDVGWVK
jgi:hypothetical protein